MTNIFGMKRTAGSQKKHNFVLWLCKGFGQKRNGSHQPNAVLAWYSPMWLCHATTAKIDTSRKRFKWIEYIKEILLKDISKSAYEICGGDPVLCWRSYNELGGVYFESDKINFDE